MNQGFQMVMRAFAKGRSHHSYIFAGPEGVGKKTAALAFAATLITGSDKQDSEYQSVLGRLERRMHPDFTWIEPEGRVLKVEEVRGLPRELAYPPLQGKKRVVVLNHAERMQAAAANAILKILEEPPEYVTFILITLEQDLLLATLRSRSQLVRFAPLADSEVEKILRAKSSVINAGDLAAAPQGDLLALLAGAIRWAGGSVTRGQRFLEDPEYRGLIEAATDALLKNWEAKVNPALETLQFLDSLKTPDEMRIVLAAWLQLLRDFALISAGVSDRYQGENKDRLYRIADKSRAGPGKTVAEFSPLIDTAMNELEAHVNPKLLMTALCADLRL